MSFDTIRRSWWLSEPPAAFVISPSGELVGVLTRRPEFDGYRFPAPVKMSYGELETARMTLPMMPTVTFWRVGEDSWRWKGEDGGHPDDLADFWPVTAPLPAPQVFVAISKAIDERNLRTAAARLLAALGGKVYVI